MNDDRRILRASTFDEVAELYDRSRIGPPEQLFDDLFTLAEIAPPADSSVLEVGCGTGQATQQLARRGCRVVCVEMGANLARIARRNLAQFPNVTVMTTRFEDWEPCDERFDIVLAVTSWHWIDPEVRYAKAARVLKPEGVLAFTTGAHVFPPGFDPFFIEIQLCYDALGEEYAAGWSPAPPEHWPGQSATNSVLRSCCRSNTSMWFSRCPNSSRRWRCGTSALFMAFSSARPPKPLLQIAADPRHLGGRVGFLAVLHTWGQNLHYHPHLHCVVPGGGIASDQSHWISCRRQFLFPVKVLSRLFRAKFVVYLKAAFREGELGFHGELKSLGEKRTFFEWLTRVAETEWIVLPNRRSADPDRCLNTWRVIPIG